MENIKDYYNNLLFNSVKKRLKSNMQLMGENNLYYKNFFEQNKIDIAQIKQYSDFVRIPHMNKQIYKENIDHFYSSVKDKGCRSYITSGSSGIPVNIYRSREDDAVQNFILCKYRNRRCENIIFEKMVYLIHTYAPHNKREKHETRKLEKYYDNDNTYYFFYYINDDILEEIFNFLNEFKPGWIIGGVSVIYYLADFIKRKKRNFEFKLCYIECISEYLPIEKRTLISEVFGINPVSIYGANEVNVIAYECECGNLHVINESVFVEIVGDNDKPKGNVIVSSLANKNTPFLRYVLGDIAEWGGVECKCKNTSPYLKLERYRSNDYIIKKDGTKIEVWFVNDFMNAMQEELGIIIKQYMFVQKDYNSMEITISMDEKHFGFREQMEKRFKLDIEFLFNEEVDVKFNYTNEVLPVDPITGKFRYFKSLVK